MTPTHFDISPRITARTGVFPGDVPFSRRVSLDFKLGHHLLLSSIETTLHIGAHADGPNHYAPGRPGIDERDPFLYMGQAQVIRVDVSRGECITIAHLRGRAPQAPRVLFHTGTFPNPEEWNSDFAAISPELVDHLAAHQVKLIGIDTPSIDPETSQSLDAHARVAQHDLAILEGVVLTAVPEGLYTLIAPPLRLSEGDASPVRAILLTDLSVLGR